MKDGVRVDMPCGSFVYAAGWCAHGPRGVIVDTQQESIVVAEQMMKDFLARTDVTGIRKVLHLSDFCKCSYHLTVVY